MADNKLTSLLASIVTALFVNLVGGIFFEFAQEMHQVLNSYVPFINLPPPRFDTELIKYTITGILLSPSEVGQILMESFNFIDALRTNSIEKLFQLTMSLLSILNVWISTWSPGLSLRISLTLGILYVLFLFEMYLADLIINFLQGIIMSF
ncbi:hypothetical protein [Neomoorella mulderi]|uniref:hypothetical protein n=1 Tax=Neomoorella mulderi TaxID=202604 RepID=UPI000784555E|nr:hypothetical protein [Moorella mulderi]